jgi:glycosyltransferase involved in cell wall biosynthesis
MQIAQLEVLRQSTQDRPRTEQHWPDDTEVGGEKRLLTPIRRLLILSYAFAPSIGGIETVSDVLARLFSQRGYDVVVVTAYAQVGQKSSDPFEIVRRPSPWKLIRLIHRADLVLQSNISLLLAWPLWILFLRKPFILVHHTPVGRLTGRLTWQARLKRRLLWRPYCLSVSKYLAGTFETPSGIIGNPYAEGVFRKLPQIERDKDLLFVGRLLPVKGVDVLLQAFRIVLEKRPGTKLTIVGRGPEEQRLHQLAQLLGVGADVEFLGPKHGDDLARVMNQHRILVVPSLSKPPEALPVVPVEGIACGCVPIASKQGGLPESVGEAGLLFREGDPEDLARSILLLLDNPELIWEYQSRAEQHLKSFSLNVIADAYEAHFAACR